ncbi:MAG TPA: hypothetical protein PLQ19_10920 [Aeromicrobium sp.]|nr:hypothetical protein [Aeromicrobium sp.]
MELASSHDFESIVRFALLVVLAGWLCWILLVFAVAIFDRRLAAKFAPAMLRGLLLAGTCVATTVPAHGADGAHSPLDGLLLPDRPAITAAPAPTPAFGAQVATAKPKPETRTTVVVKPGDCLWSIVSERHRGADNATIAAEVAAWHQTNREVIGQNPNLLQPGQHLTEPGEK